MTASPPNAAVPPAGRPRSFAFQLLLTVAIGLAPILALELVARLAGFGSRPMYVPEGELLWALIPNQRVRNHVTCRPVTIDARGMRVVPGAPDGADRLQVLCFGNSITFGYGVADSETYESLLQGGLERREPGRWRFLNAGVMGYNMYYERLRLRELQGRGVRPDVIVVGFCFNDVPTWPGEHFSPPERERIKKSIHFKNVMRHVGLYNFFVERLMTQQIFRWRQKYLPFGFGTGAKRRAASPAPVPPPGPGAAPSSPPGSRGAPVAAAADTSWQADWFGYYRRQVATTLETMKGLHVPVLAVVWPDRKNIAAMNRKSFEEVCRAHDVPYVDLQAILDADRGPHAYFDDVHPDAATLRLLTDRGVLPFWLAEEARIDSLRAAGSPAAAGTKAGSRP